MMGCLSAVVYLSLRPLIASRLSNIGLSPSPFHHFNILRRTITKFPRMALNLKSSYFSLLKIKEYKSVLSGPKTAFQNFH